MKRNHLYYFCLLVSLLFSQLGTASHIVGGYMKYECISTGRYHVTLTVYRNCNSQAQDNFDNFAPITVYRGNVTVPFLEQSINLNQPVTEIPTLIFNPCIEPPDDFCLQEGTYDFIVDLPVSTESYHITYQRCCRNWNIANIENPRDIGSTFTIEITPAAQTVCNSSPDFVGYPPPIICVNQAWSFDHSAIDPNGDQIVYEFCSPLEGAGNVGTGGNPGDPTGCDGLRPNPACPPPYFGVQFVLPEYSALEPMGGNPLIGINAFTGEITGMPTLQGQFSIGVCVSEYRNGVLMSVLRRDVQFTVVQCTQLVDALLDDNIFELENNTYKIEQCGNDPISISNFSIGQNFVDDFYWEISGNGQTQTYQTWDIDLGVLAPGHYDGTLYLNPMAIGCSDSTFLSIDVYDVPEANFVYTYDTCSVDPINFSDASLPFGGPIEKWDWNFGDGVSVDQNPVYQFPDPGNFQIELKVTDVNNCEDSIENEISWFPAPEVIVIEPNTFNGCAPLLIGFENLSWPIDETYDLTWDFGMAGGSKMISPFVNFEEVGSYDVSLKIVSPFNCVVEENWPGWITVNPYPTASFEIISSPENILNPNVELETTSPDGVFWDWYIESLDPQYGPSTLATLPDTGYFRVDHVVENIFGCLDTATQYIYVEPYNSFFLPNAFTPNGDGKNEVFHGVGLLRGANSFSLKIWNRWGELIFETNDPNEGWNGKVRNVGTFVIQGAYPYEVQYVRYDGELRKDVGMVTLIR